MGQYRRTKRSGIANARRRKASFIETSQDVHDPVVARLVYTGQPVDAPADARQLLMKAMNAKAWAKTRKRVTYFVTPGGFLCVDIPGAWGKRRSWDSDEGDAQELFDLAHEHVQKKLLTTTVREAIAQRARRITLGVDLFFSDSSIAQIVLVYDPKKERPLHATGKSFPTKDEARTLIQIADVDTHVWRDGGRNVAIFGCHDLNVFSPRSLALAKGHRAGRSRDYRNAVIGHRPTIVLHHPHRTDTAQIWAHSWKKLRDRLGEPGLVWASAIVHVWWHEGRYRKGRQPLDAVCEKTAHGNVLNIVVSSRAR